MNIYIVIVQTCLLPPYYLYRMNLSVLVIWHLDLTILLQKWLDVTVRSILIVSILVLQACENLFWFLVSLRLTIFKNVNLNGYFYIPESFFVFLFHSFSLQVIHCVFEALSPFSEWNDWKKKDIRIREGKYQNTKLRWKTERILN